MSDFLNRAMQSPAVRSVQKGLTSVKDSLVENWALSEDEDDDEYFQRAPLTPTAGGGEQSAYNRGDPHSTTSQPLKTIRSPSLSLSLSFFQTL